MFPLSAGVPESEARCTQHVGLENVRERAAPTQRTSPRGLFWVVFIFTSVRAYEATKNTDELQERKALDYATLTCE